RSPTPKARSPFFSRSRAGLRIRSSTPSFIVDRAIAVPSCLPLHNPSKPARRPQHVALLPLHENHCGDRLFFDTIHARDAFLTRTSPKKSVASRHSWVARDPPHAKHFSRDLRASTLTGAINMTGSTSSSNTFASLQPGHWFDIANSHMAS